MFNYYDCVNLNTRKDNYNGETLMNYEGRLEKEDVFVVWLLQNKYQKQEDLANEYSTEH